MREFSKIAPNIWSSKKFKSLETSDDRLAYFYLLTSPHSNWCGCYSLPIGYMAADLGWSLEASRKAIDSLSKGYLIKYDEAENTVLIVNWFAHNPPTNSKHAVGIWKNLCRANSETLQVEAAQALVAICEAKGFALPQACLDEIAKAIDRVSKGYRHGDRDRDGDRDGDEDGDKSETEKQIITSEASAFCTGHDGLGNGAVENHGAGSTGRPGGEVVALPGCDEAQGRVG
jgi:hypothetical protein